MIILSCFKANELNQNELPPPPWGQWSNGINEPSINRGITPHRGGNGPMELMNLQSIVELRPTVGAMIQWN
jgi:hypothetical protein